MNERIWELDVFRGICILGMVVVHAVYDLVTLYAMVDWQLPQTFLFVQKWGGVLFLLLSGICVTLGSRSVRRGIIVFLCGFLCTLVTWGMYAFGMADKSLIIYFGVLHCLGSCMMLWPLFRRLPWWLLAVLGVAMAAVGLYFAELPGVSTYLLMPFGRPWAGFASSDYFPLLPNLGFFLVGAVLGRLVYGKKQTLFPKVKGDHFIIRFFQGCGKHSLWIYLLHQPILSGLFYVIALLK